MLVGVDGSAGSTAALAWACADARLEGRPLAVLLGWTADGLPRPVYQAALTADRRGLAAAAADLLDRTVERVPMPDPAPPLRRLVIQGDPVDALVHEAARSALTVVGARGPGLAHRVMAASVAHRFLHRATGPVVVVRATPATVGLAPDPDPDPDPRPVVVGVDGSPASLAAVRWAARQAALRRVPLRLLHGYQMTISPYGVLLDTVSPDLRRTSECMLADVVATELADWPELDVAVAAVDNTPSRALLDASAGAQLLAVGTRGHGGFAELVLGSTSHQLVLHAHCPVAVLHAPQ